MNIIKTSDRDIDRLIDYLDDQHNPTHRDSSREALERWLEEPDGLTQAQRERIEEALSR
ncbi:hypothetical protein [Halomonas sp. GD1P12]|uniref:hypothetical protein n=1 Tax=Halomonas sp. GD1P12 TaxID=2982691 RepID=UPI0021E3CC02|nr:hypothetical protein [Halomonas sp. GD1P12]UYF99338.1 hypothetical protein OCT39_14035 [Halomonas sp. GD1P12]